MRTHNNARTAIVAFYNVYPPVSGAATVSFNTTRFLAGDKLLLHVGRELKKSCIEAGLETIAFPCPSDNHLIKTISLLRQMPRMAKAITQFQPDLIILEGASWTVFYLVFSYFLGRHRTRRRTAYHAHNVEYILRKQKNNFAIAWLTRWAEGRILNRCDAVTAVSDIDAAQIRRLYGVKAISLPNGADVSRFERVTRGNIGAIKTKYGLRGKVILFMGLTTFKPNREAIDFLIREVMPAVVSVNAEAVIAVIGGDVDYHRSWLINPGSIPFEEIPAFIGASDICVAPLFSGSGTRLKILEYMAAGKAVVATSKGAEGIPCESGRDIIIAETQDQFADAILRLLKRSQFSRQIARNGRRLVRKSFSWEALIQAFQKELQT